MTKQVQKEETPNPYNAKKDWHNEDKPFESAKKSGQASRRRARAGEVEQDAIFDNAMGDWRCPPSRTCIL